MTDYNVIKIITEPIATIVCFNTTSLGTEQGLEDVAQQISELIKNQKPKNIIIDFSGVKFFSSQALGLLLDAKKKSSAQKGNVLISGINPQLYRVFKITNLDKIFKFYPDTKAAINDLKKLQKSN
ncbi:MAG: STAS domain-containing protein [Sedimentisphaerales bacterium]|jgi:anti-anti-sigma factor